MRKIEELLGMPRKTIGTPLWVIGDCKRCSMRQREINCFDFVSSALDQIHSREMMARVILGEQKFVNTEAPRAIAGLQCFSCKTPFEHIRSFKCHHWDYPKPALIKALGQMKAVGKKK